MKRITIQKQGIITNKVELPEYEANAWLQYHLELGTFGANAYSFERPIELTPAVYETQSILISEAVLDEEGNEISPAVYEDQQVLISDAVWGVQTIQVPAEFEVIEEDITGQLAVEALKAQKVELGKAARQVCQKVLDLVSGYNLDRELTIEQITQMQQTFANAEAALRAGRPTFAKSFISAIEADGVLVTQEMKDLCLQLLEGY